jgi:hypothetical protein
MRVLQFSPTPLQALLNPLSGQEMLLMAESQGPSMRADNPSLRDRIGNSVYDLASNLGLGSTANRMRNEGTAVMDFIPGVGEVLGVNDAMNDFNAGNYGMAAAGLGLTAVGAVPGVGDAAAAGVKKGIKAYHGSPHSFDRFSMDKIGTGEGAQAYGHGLYFAESEDVARSYRDSLAQTVAVDGKPLLQNNRRVNSTGDADVDDALIAHNGDLDAAIADEKAFADNLAAQGRETLRRSGADPYALVRKLEGLRGQVSSQNTGHMYEVNINADPDDFLDWDAPLRDQPHIAERLGVDPYARSKRADEIIRNIQEDMKAAGRTEMDAIDRQNYELAERLNQEFAFEAGSGYAPRSQEMLDDLRAKGVKGVKYRDYGSRGSDGGTRNYVVFDDSLIEIVRKYGLAGAVAAGLISQEMAAQMQAQGEL